MYLPGRRANAGHCLRLDSVTGKVHPLPGRSTDLKHCSALGPLTLVRNAVRMTGAADAVRSPSPGQGDHTDEVLVSLGYSAAQIGQLRAQAVISKREAMIRDGRAPARSDPATQ